MCVRSSCVRICIQQVQANSKGDGGIFEASAGSSKGTAGIVGYSTDDPNVWFTFLVSDQNAGNNRSLVGLSPNTVPTNQETYNEVWQKSDSASIGVPGGTIKVNLLSLIGFLEVDNMTKPIILGYLDHRSDR